MADQFPQETIWGGKNWPDVDTHGYWGSTVDNLGKFAIDPTEYIRKDLYNNIESLLIEVRMLATGTNHSSNPNDYMNFPAKILQFLKDNGFGS